MATDRPEKGKLQPLNIKREVTDTWYGDWQLTPDLPGGRQDLTVHYRYTNPEGGGRIVRREVSGEFEEWDYPEVAALADFLRGLCESQIRNTTSGGQHSDSE